MRGASKMKRALSGLVSLAVVSLALPVWADAPITDKPVVKPGTTWDYADRVGTIPCKHWEFMGAKDGFNVAQCEGYKSLSNSDTGALVRILDKDGDKAVQFSPSAVPMPFPVKVGNMWSGKYSAFTADDGAQWDGTQSCTVAAFEPVTVKAGTFDAYRIECDGTFQAGPVFGHANTTSWWAPKAATTVKSVNAAAPKWNLELTGYSLK
jgi:hypothetical protein